MSGVENAVEQHTLFSLYPQFDNLTDQKIGTKNYLEASRGIVKFVEQLGTIFAPVRSDINGNIEKLNTIYESNPIAYETLNSIVEVESKTIPDGEFKIGTDALLWLTRALEYINLFLTYFCEDFAKGTKSEDLSVYFKRAYEHTLEKHHNWFVRQLFHLCLNAAPSRSNLLQLIVVENTKDNIQEDNVFQEIEIHTNRLNTNVKAVHSLFQSFNVPF